MTTERGALGLGMESKAQTRARSALAAGQTATSAAGVAAADQEQGRSRRRPRSVVDPGYRYEFIEADDEAAEVASAAPDRYRPSGSGGSIQGFAGTLPKPDVRASGLITLAGNESGDGARIPMLPESWGGP
ncbi:hypothetical protein A5760_04365 [Mycobacterium colombiense]|uniref:PPE-PPW subfamily C-terminal domain-containing protein n=1 Tax=Mycobacterium colombiense TaxID=339268 RepID=A0A1A0VTU5_9MYCO|nr:hypothetical protein [Mycobacterium colombiense]OBB86629.1 hypothetical protein A5760_04365 [Mycobacterium colombiense]